MSTENRKRRPATVWRVTASPRWTVSASINSEVKVTDVELSAIRSRTAPNNTSAAYPNIYQTVQSRLRECDRAHRATQAGTRLYLSPSINAENFGYCYQPRRRRVVRLIWLSNIHNRPVGPTNCYYQHPRMRRAVERSLASVRVHIKSKVGLFWLAARMLDCTGETTISTTSVYLCKLALSCKHDENICI